MMRKLANRLLGGGNSSGESPIGSPPQPLRRIVQDIVNDLGKDWNLNDDYMKHMEERDAKRSLLFDYCEQQPGIIALLEEFKVSRDHLEKLHDELVLAGAGQWRSGHWVGASAVAYPTSLRYLLNNWEVDPETNLVRISTDGLKSRMAFALLMYFERGEALE